MPGAVRRVGVEERRARMARRHHLAREARAPGPAEAARGVVALHSTTASSVFLSIWARTRDMEPEHVETALYEERALVRMLAMRRTVFVVPAELAPVLHGACTRAIAVLERRRLVQLLEGAGIAADGDAWLAEVEGSTVRALRSIGEATAAELARIEPRLKHQIRLAQGKSYEGTVSVATRVLFVAAAEGRIMRGRPLGSWASSQYRWSPIETWLPGGTDGLPTELAQADLARLWLEAFGPAPVADLRWWTGWTVREVNRALSLVDTVEVDLEGRPGIALAGDLEAPAPPEQWVALLPCLDPTVMGWSERGWFLGPHAAALFDRSGNAGPTVWFDGRVVGGWAQRRSGEVAVRLLEDIGAEARSMVALRAGELERWLGPVRVTPGFRTPLEKELSG